MLLDLKYLLLHLSRVTVQCGIISPFILGLCISLKRSLSQVFNHAQSQVIGINGCLQITKSPNCRSVRKMSLMTL